MLKTVSDSCAIVGSARGHPGKEGKGKRYAMSKRSCGTSCRQAAQSLAPQVLEEQWYQNGCILWELQQPWESLWGKGMLVVILPHVGLPR